MTAATSHSQGMLSLYLPCTFPVPSLYLPCTFPVLTTAGTLRAGTEWNVEHALAMLTKGLSKAMQVRGRGLLMISASSYI